MTSLLPRKLTNECSLPRLNHAPICHLALKDHIIQGALSIENCHVYRFEMSPLGCDNERVVLPPRSAKKLQDCDHQAHSVSYAGGIVTTCAAWVRGANPISLLRPPPEDALRGWIASSRVKRSVVCDDDPALIQAVA